MIVQRVDAELEVLAADVLNERVTGDHPTCCPIGLQLAHRSQPCLQPAVVALDPIVPVPLGVVLGVRDQVLDRGALRLVET
jgi:hypothetical protein